MILSRRVIPLALVLVVLLLALSFVAQLDLPAASGPYPVGRAARSWLDRSRPETLSGEEGAFRSLPALIWYPAEAGTGSPTPYFPHLARVAPALAASGEVSPLAVFGLRFIRSRDRWDARLADAAPSYPVILLSPGNGTNVEFYSALASELASHGFIVVGINHPYDVAAVALEDGEVARFVNGPTSQPGREAWVAERVAVRTADLLFTLTHLEGLTAAEDPLLAEQLDLSRAGVMGHSLGGIAAAEACRASEALRACLNLDGMQRGGPFSTSEQPTPPHQPFMLITKERSLHPALQAIFEGIPSGSYRVVVPGARHDSFTDGPLLLPSLLPLPNGADQHLLLIRSYTLAFFEQALHLRPHPLLGASARSDRVQVEVYPSQLRAE